MISRYGIFCKVIESRSFTRAAAEIGYSQSAVSQTVKALEQELGVAVMVQTLLNRLSPDLVTCEIEGSPTRGIFLAWQNSEV